MRVAIIADTQVDAERRFDEAARIHAWLVEDIRRQQADLVLHSGDVYERASTPEERALVADFVTALSADAPVVIVAGNHDAPGELPILARLRTAHPVIVEEDHGVHLVHTAAGPCAVACLGWPRRADVQAQVRAEGGAPAREVTHAVGVEQLRAKLSAMRVELHRHGAPRILLAHAMVRGSRIGIGQPFYSAEGGRAARVLMGAEFELGLEDLSLADADLVALGHVHQGQDWDLDGVPIVYPGSPWRRDFGELGAKTYVLADFDRGPDGWRLASWRRVETPARRMVVVRVAWTGNGWAEDLSELDVAGAEVRIIYRADADHAGAARTAALQLRQDLQRRGAIDVRKPEGHVRARTRARAEDVAKATGLPEKLSTLWNTRRPGLSEAQRRDLLQRLAALDAEAARERSA